MASYLSNALFFALDLLGPAPERWMKKTKIGVEECKRSKWQIKENRRVRKREKEGQRQRERESIIHKVII